jgi:acetoin utilization deacetylase AcuC-like enzyme
LNNAAIAANWLSHEGKVALLDIDYHAGNGTQEIFYDRSDVLTISIHADPAYEYPYYSGYVDETGSGDGLGYHKNHPLPFGTADDAYLDTLRQALATVREFSPRFLVLSAGMDISKDDPLGKFKITGDGIRRIGSAIALEMYPTLIVMEGGYNLSGLGTNVVSLLENFITGS